MDEFLLATYSRQDCEQLSKIFRDAILSIDGQYYSPEEKCAWIGQYKHKDWALRFECTQPIVAYIEG